jgi:hypothetical protein
MLITKRVTTSDLISTKITADSDKYFMYLCVATEVLHEARRYLFEMEWQLDDAVARFTAAGSINEVIEMINSILARLPNERADRFGVVTQDHALPFDALNRQLIKLDPNI